MYMDNLKTVCVCMYPSAPSHSATLGLQVYLDFKKIFLMSICVCVWVLGACVEA